MNTLYYTVSVCPVCLKSIGAEIREYDDGVYMDKCCEIHGNFHTLIWAESRGNYAKWLEYGGLPVWELPRTPEEAWTIFKENNFESKACGQPCSAALMTTNRCNLNCPICFTRDKKESPYEPDLEECKRLIDNYLKEAGEAAPLELCGGEPTVRDDLPRIADYARNIGFDYIQLNSNGVKLAEDADYCIKLKESGITTVYLGFDGVTERSYHVKYGCPLLDIKKKAIQNCGAAGMAVVLAVCTIPGGNDEQLGEILNFAIANMPVVKGVHFQPISYFGIFPEVKINRITIPEVLRKLEQQTDGKLRIKDFQPGTYEHPQCSFMACYYKVGSQFKPLTHITKYVREAGDYKRIRQSVKKTWLPSDHGMLTVGGMAFQDAWNIDLIRIMNCSIHIMGRDKTLMPLCSKYLSSADGARLNENIS